MLVLGVVQADFAPTSSRRNRFEPRPWWGSASEMEICSWMGEVYKDGHTDLRNEIPQTSHILFDFLGKARKWDDSLGFIKWKVSRLLDCQLAKSENFQLSLMALVHSKWWKVSIVNCGYLTSGKYNAETSLFDFLHWLLYSIVRKYVRQRLGNYTHFSCIHALCTLG